MTDTERALREAASLRDRIRRLREAIRMVGRGGLDFVERYTPRYKRDEPRPDSLPFPSAQAWVDEVLAKDDAEAARALLARTEGEAPKREADWSARQTIKPEPCGYCGEPATVFFSFNPEATPDICPACFVEAQGFAGLDAPAPDASPEGMI